jgi:hypothetical protein
MKIKLLTICLLLFTSQVFAESSLPPCEGEDYKMWTNCYGTCELITNTEKKTLRKFSGEFGSTPGVREGKGKSKVYINGKFHFEYIGEFENNKTHGQGSYTFADGSKYVGELKYSKYHGQGTWTSPGGDTWVGEFKENKMNGQGTVTYVEGNTYVGELKDNKRHGQGTMTWGSDKYVGAWQNNLPHGQGTYTWKNGSKYVGAWQNGDKHGKGTYTKHDGEQHITTWVKGKRNGIGTLVYKAGDSKCQEWINNTRYDCETPGLAEEKDRKLNQAMNCYKNNSDNSKKKLMSPHVDVLSKMWEQMENHADSIAGPSEQTHKQMIEISNTILQIGGC